jgi:hypothetical protein
MDIQQLMYLCDPTIHIVTHDENMKIQCNQSKQSERIHHYPEFIRKRPVMAV